MTKRGTITFVLLLIIGGLVSACENTSTEAEEPATSAPATEFDPNAPTVSARVPVGPVNPGDSFEIEINFDRFPPTEGGGITLHFDPAIVQVNRVDLDSAWNFVTSEGQIDNTGGQVRDILVSSFNHPGGSAVIARLDVTATGAGAGDIVIEGSLLNPFAASGDKLAVQFIKGNIEVR